MALHPPILVSEASHVSSTQRLLAAAPLVSVVLAAGYLVSAAGSELGEIIRAVAYCLPGAFLLVTAPTARRLAHLTPPMPSSLVIAGLVGTATAIVLAQDGVSAIPADALRAAASLCLLPVLTRLARPRQTAPSCGAS